jgi:hypothetical protein
MGELKGFKALEDGYIGPLMDTKENELNMYSKFRNIYNKLDDDDFNDIVGYVKDYYKDRTIEDFQAIKFLTNMVTKRPRLLRLVKHLL